MIKKIVIVFLLTLAACMDHNNAKYSAYYSKGQLTTLRLFINSNTALFNKYRFSIERIDLIDAKNKTINLLSSPKEIDFTHHLTHLEIANKEIPATVYKQLVIVINASNTAFSIPVQGINATLSNYDLSLKSNNSVNTNNSHYTVTLETDIDALSKTPKNLLLIHEVTQSLSLNTKNGVADKEQPYVFTPLFSLIEIKDINNVLINPLDNPLHPFFEGMDEALKDDKDLLPMKGKIYQITKDTISINTENGLTDVPFNNLIIKPESNLVDTLSIDNLQPLQDVFYFPGLNTLFAFPLRLITQIPTIDVTSEMTSFPILSVNQLPMAVINNEHQIPIDLSAIEIKTEELIEGTFAFVVGHVFKDNEKDYMKAEVVEVLPLNQIEATLDFSQAEAINIIIDDQNDKILLGFDRSFNLPNSVSRITAVRLSKI